MLLANIEKLPDVPPQNQSEPTSTEAAHDIPNPDAAKPDSATDVVPETDSSVDKESAAAAPQNDSTATPSDSAP